MSDEKPDKRVEERVDERAEHAPADPPEDLDVPKDESEDVKGGYSFRQAWPKKYSGWGSLAGRPERRDPRLPRGLSRTGERNSQCANVNATFILKLTARAAVGRTRPGGRNSSKQWLARATDEGGARP